MKMKITAKCSDMFSASLVNNKGKQVGTYEGYVPGWFPNPNVTHYGDYVELTIDMDAGKIENWKKPSDAAIEKDFS